MDTLARNWWALALRGLFAVLFGVLAFAWPGITLGALVVLFGTYSLVDGVLALVAVLSGRTEGMPWWAMLLEGFVGIAAGFVTFLWPGITALALLCVIAAWAIVTGFFQVIAAIRLRKEIRGEWLLVVSGLLSIAFGVILLVDPAAGALAVVWLIGTYAVAAGVLLIVLGFRLRSRLHRGSLGVVPLSGEAVGRGARNAERDRHHRVTRDGEA
ncbi:HdeD family acid-resistance protein [Paludisphaera soli]|uniref:HdeD family acid-resistance protein n=1 Tax=Paludisphaera soli TaxID=2712865 RepID=UPI0013ECC895|nr:HdeD family acid-resistance protein [Paludisphaera soli]